MLRFALDKYAVVKHDHSTFWFCLLVVPSSPRHPLPIHKLTLIFGIPRLLAFFFVAVFLSVVPANEKLPAMAAGHHHAHKAGLTAAIVFLYRGFRHHVGKG